MYVYLCCLHLNINGIAFKISLSDVAALLPLLFCPSGIKAERKALSGAYPFSFDCYFTSYQIIIIVINIDDDDDGVGLHYKPNLYLLLIVS